MSKEDTGLSDNDETFTNEDTQDTEVAELEDIEVNLDDYEDDDETNGTEESTEDEAATESKEDEADEPEVDEETDDEQSEESETTPPKEDPEADRKRIAQEEYKRREAEKQLRSEREEREKQDIQRYLEEAEDDRDELSKREMEVERYNLNRERATIMTERLEVGLDKAVASIDLFTTGSDIEKGELAASLDDFEAMYVTRDKQGNPLEVRRDINEFLQTKAESIRKLTQTGVQKQIKSKTKSRSRADTIPSKAPKENKDPYLDAFYEEANRF